MPIATTPRLRPTAACIPLALALLASAGSAHAELFPSTATEVQASGACRSELWFSQYESRWQGQKQQGYRGVTELGCGVTDRLDLRVGVSHSDSESWRSDGAHFGARLRLFGQPRDATQISLGTNIYASGFNGAPDQDGFRYRSAGFSLAARHESPQGHRFEGRLGHNRPRGGGSWEDWSLSYAYALSPAWELVADAQGSSGQKPWHALGLRWSPSNTWQFAAQVGKPRAPEGFGSPATDRSLAVRWTPSRAWQLTGTLSHRPANGPSFVEFTGLGLNLRHDF